jgi:hypothetical protein
MQQPSASLKEDVLRIRSQAKRFDARFVTIRSLRKEYAASDVVEWWWRLTSMQATD